MKALLPLFLAAFAFVAACGSTNKAVSEAPEPQTIRISGSTSRGGAGTLRAGPTTTARVDTLWVSLDRVWKELPGVYGSLEIPIERFDAEANVIGNSALKVYRRLGKTPMTRYLDCGTTQIGPNADSYEIILTVLTQIHRVQSDTSKTTVATTVQAMAKPIQFRGEYVPCTSKNLIETKVVDMLKFLIAP